MSPLCLFLEGLLISRFFTQPNRLKSAPGSSLLILLCDKKFKFWYCYWPLVPILWWIVYQPINYGSRKYSSHTEISYCMHNKLTANDRVTLKRPYCERTNQSLWILIMCRLIANILKCLCQQKISFGRLCSKVGLGNSVVTIMVTRSFGLDVANRWRPTANGQLALKMDQS